MGTINHHHQVGQQQKLFFVKISVKFPKMKMNIVAVMVALAAIIANFSEAKPQCGLRWRGPCKRSFSHRLDQHKLDQHKIAKKDAYLVDTLENELENLDQLKDEDLASNLETELLDIIKRSKAVKRFTE